MSNKSNKSMTQWTFPCLSGGSRNETSVAVAQKPRKVERVCVRNFFLSFSFFNFQYIFFLGPDRLYLGILFMKVHDLVTRHLVLSLTVILPPKWHWIVKFGGYPRYLVSDVNWWCDRPKCLMCESPPDDLSRMKVWGFEFNTLDVFCMRLPR
jgi:hypothetical protein